MSGVAMGLSWLCFYKAIQISDVSRVSAIDKSSLVLTILFAMFLGKAMSAKVVIGGLLITAGTLFMML
ncbi:MULTISPECIES: EamA family transporter [Geobacillus]|uniref:EamA family transporter n=2 Tax=Anoxybacillaceae TaxID=3120669 RepID=A0ABY9Q7P2_GEOTD|nr:MULTISPECIES: EamA family transporter [Geobacillus]MED3716256.1 EamA family transporter [Geobacillus thermodenitrificans]MED4918022.1 EamA family transporter [Geobacillus thermodenitrificans]WMV74884.1 EamA family transporter [Geobacillus thermodenitrificans]